MQVDGEPSAQKPAVFKIKRKKQQAYMLHRAEENDLITDMSELLDWAEEKGVIAMTQHATLMREFSRRIESKKRVARPTNNNIVQRGKDMVGGLRNVTSMPNFLQQGQNARRESDDNDNFVGMEVDGGEEEKGGEYEEEEKDNCRVM